MSAPQPLYEQVKDHVLRRIRSGEWGPGARVQSEHELVRELKVSRMTANRAIRELVHSGVLSRVAGLGTFVADLKLAGHPLQIRSIASEIRERGHVYRADVVSSERIVPSTEIRARLGLKGRARHSFRSLIVHFDNDVALQVEDRYVNPAAAPGYLAVDFSTVTSWSNVKKLEGALLAAGPSVIAALDSKSVVDAVVNHPVDRPEMAAYDFRRNAIPEVPALAGFRVFTRTVAVLQIENGKYNVLSNGFIDILKPPDLSHAGK